MTTTKRIGYKRPGWGKRFPVFVVVVAQKSGILFYMDSILRTKRTSNFTSVNNDFIRDENLSWKAKGIIIYIMSLPTDWHLHLSELAKHAKDGRDATYNGVRELIDNGYCKRTEVRDSRGLFSGYEYVVSDIKEFAPQTENPETGNPHTEKPYTDNPQLLNTNKEQNVSLTDNNKPADGGLFPDEPKSEFKPITVTRPRRTSENLCTFECSRYNDMELFLSEFKGPEFANVDMVYYYHAVADWSAQKGKKMRDWIATARNFIRSDMEKNKLHTLNKQGATLDADAMEYLQMMSE